MTLDSIANSLRDAGIDEALTEAYILAEHYLHIPKYRLAALRGDDLPASAEDEAALDAAIRRRITREPLTYILGTAYFMDEEYEVSPDCLIPRPETELLVLEAAKHCPENGRILDVCTGSGCIAVSLLRRRDDLSGDAVEISAPAASLARRNAVRNGVDDRLNVIEADMFSWEIDGEYDVIVSNPPYVTADEMASLDPELSFEPRSALTDGGDGLSFYRELCERYAGHVRKDGVMLCEIGCAEGKAVLGIARENGLCGEIVRDLAGLDRMIRISF